MLVPVLYGHNRIITSSLSHRAPSLYLLPTMNAITCCWVCLLAVVLLGPYALVNAAPTQATPNTYLAPVALGAPSLLSRRTHVGNTLEEIASTEVSAVHRTSATVEAAKSDPAGTLPCKRPKVWSKPRTLADATWSIRKNATTNVATLSIEHAPVVGVTGTMMEWMFRNLDKVAVDYRTGDKYQMYVLMHPVDNVYLLYDTPTLIINSTDPSSGSAWKHDHFYASGCIASCASGKPSVTCPAVRSGFTCTSPAPTVEKATRFMEASFYAKRLNRNGFTALVPAGSVPGLLLEHRWMVNQAASSARNVPPRLYVSQKFTFGLELDGAAEINMELQQTLAASTNGDFDLLLAKVALHEIEIVGFLPSWLPRYYSANN